MKFGGFSRAKCALFITAFVVGSFAIPSDSHAAIARHPKAAPRYAFAAAADTPDIWFPDPSNRLQAIGPVSSITQPPEPLLPVERPLIPLPASAWTGLMGVIGIVLVTVRKALLRFIT